MIAQDANLELFVPLVFNSTSIEFERHLTVVAKAPMEGSCLRVLGQVVISGDFFIKDCQNQLTDSTKEWADGAASLFPDFKDGMKSHVEDVPWDFEEEASLLEATDGRTHGGGIYALNIIQKNGKITIENCSSKSIGGAIYVEDSFIQEGGDMMIKHCRADKRGGAIFSRNNFRQDGGHLTIQNCTAVSSDGGAIYVEDSFIQEGGDMMIKHCRADKRGGAIFSRNNFRQDGGHLTIQNCTVVSVAVSSDGGAIYVEESFTQEGGEMMIKHCHAGNSGGGIVALKNFTQNNGVLQVEDCSARSDGGALYAKKSFRQTGGSISLSNCRAKYGGGLEAADFEQIGGAMRIQSCEAAWLGGGLRIWEKIFRQDGELHVRACRARRGGALYLSSDKVEQGESATALVDARQFKREVSFTNKWATHNLPHTTTHSCPASITSKKIKQKVVDILASRFFKFAAATPTDCWTFTNTHPFETFVGFWCGILVFWGCL